jgi:RNA polymerase sigma-70 factor, ECF subfamily
METVMMGDELSDRSRDSDLAHTAADRSALLPAAPDQRELDAARASFDRATHTILREFGDEIRTYLRARTSNRASMEEVFAVFSEDVWKGLPRYRAEGQVRSWIYVLARNALARHVRFKQRWRSRHQPVELDELSSEARQSLPARLGERAQLEPLLAQLTAADRALLEQRLVQALPWREIARNGRRASELTGEAELERESARLRKRFQLLLQNLRALAADGGIDSR